MASYADIVKRHMKKPTAKEKAKAKAQRQRLDSARRQAAARKAQKRKDKKENVQQLKREMVETRDKMLEHPLGQAATLIGGRGRGKLAPKGATAPKLGSRKLPKWDPKKHGGEIRKARAQRDYLEDPRSTRAGGGDWHPKDAPKVSRGVIHRPGTGIERAEQAAMSRVGSGHGRQGDPGWKLKKKAPAKGKLTRRARNKGKQPSMGIKERAKPARTPGQARVDYVRQETPRSAARTLKREKEWLGSVKEMKSKRQRKDRRTLPPNADALYSKPIPKQRKAVLKAKKVKEKIDRGERVWTKKAYDFRLKDWPEDPRLGRMQHKPTRQAKSGAEKPPVTGQKDQARFEGRAHITGPKVKVPKSKEVTKAKTKKDPTAILKDSWRRPKPKRKPKPKYKGPEKGQPVPRHASKQATDKREAIEHLTHDKAMHLHEQPGAKYPAKYQKQLDDLYRKVGYTTKPQDRTLPKSRRAQIAALAAGATAVGASKRKAAEDRNARVLRAKKKVMSSKAPSMPKLPASPKFPKAKKAKRKETAAQKNKRLRIKFKSAGQRQAEKYPSKEK